MTTPKPVRMWGIYDPKGRWYYKILEPYRSHAWAVAETVSDETPKRLYGRGYRCIPVLVTPITPDPESEKRDE